jgi:2-keto-4-pentenoate hydratase/2-oxohepta-3-ene-1,7-dioic acid hydratase in catechol pathway
MRLRRTTDTIAAQDPGSGRWHAIAGDLLDLLAATPAERDAAIDRDRIVEPAPLLPFAPRSLRAFSIYPEHMEQSARMLAKRFFPAPAGAAITAFETVTRRTFPALRPKRGFHDQPAMYVGNHTATLGDGEVVPWPSHTRHLDYELELGFVLAREVRDATAAEGEAAIGGFFVVNDWSARDVQAEEYRHGLFGPAVKSKTFATSLGPVVVTADELTARAGSLRGAVRVNGETWSETSTAGAAHSLGDLVAYASRGERLGAGDVFATGTLPRGCGLELDRWVQPGDVVELELEELGTLTNTVGDR